MKAPRFRGSPGIGVMMSIIVLMSCAILSLSIHRLVKAMARESLYQQRTAQADAAAMAGLEDALRQLTQNDGWRTGFSNKAVGDGTYTVSLTAAARPVITATGYSKTLVNFGKAHRTFRVTAEAMRLPKIDYALLSNGNISILQTGVQVDSYDSRISKTPGVFGSSAVVRTNGTLTLAGSGGHQIKGDAYFVSGSTPSALRVSGILTTSNTVTLPGYTGNTYIWDNDNLTGISPQSGCYFTDSVNAINNDMDIDSGETCYMKSGIYGIDDFTLDGTGRVELSITNGPVVIIARDQFDMSANETIRNPTKEPRNLIVYNTSASGTVDIHGTDSDPFYGVVIAPNCTVQIHGEIYGAVIAGSMAWDQNAEIHYDVALQEAAVNAVRLVEGSWQRLWTKQ